jgi:protein gp37
MGEQTAISWTDATFNPWWGCVNVSPGCDHCYAETFAKRTGHAVWGKDSGRRFFGEMAGERPGIHWVICGGESGPHHRPLDVAWARDLRDQCAAAEVAYFFKQVGGRTPTAGGDMLDGRVYKAFPSSPAA